MPNQTQKCAKSGSKYAKSGSKHPNSGPKYAKSADLHLQTAWTSNKSPDSFLQAGSMPVACFRAEEGKLTYEHKI